MPKAYILVEVQIQDPETYETYKKLTPATLQAFGGKFLVRGGPVTFLEGIGDPGRVVVLEFPDRETALAWWNSELYAPAKEIRQQSATSKLILVEGLE